MNERQPRRYRFTATKEDVYKAINGIPWALSNKESIEGKEPMGIKKSVMPENMQTSKVELPEPPKERDSAEYLLHQMQSKHFAGRNGLPQQLDRLAESLGGEGENYRTANAALDTFLQCLAKMRKGER